MAACGGSLTCCRKALRLGRWLEKQLTFQRSEPYVLVTGWREAKPCLSVILDMKMRFPDNVSYILPMRMFVDCEGCTILRRATWWVQSLESLDFAIDAVERQQIVSSMATPSHAMPMSELDELACKNGDAWSDMLEKVDRDLIRAGHSLRTSMSTTTTV